MHRGGGVTLSSSATNTVNQETIYEDVYQPAPNPSLINGAPTSGTSSYFDEFPEPGMSTGDGVLSGFQRHKPDIRLPSNHHIAAHTTNNNQNNF